VRRRRPRRSVVAWVLYLCLVISVLQVELNLFEQLNCQHTGLVAAGRSSPLMCKLLFIIFNLRSA
jgi:hypothetical protein